MYEARMSKGLHNQAMFCPPEGVSLDQGVRVVVAFIDKYPGDLHKDFEFLALFALAHAWPCKD